MCLSESSGLSVCNLARSISPKWSLMTQESESFHSQEYVLNMVIHKYALWDKSNLCSPGKQVCWLRGQTASDLTGCHRTKLSSNLPCRRTNVKTKISTENVQWPKHNANQETFNHINALHSSNCRNIVLQIAFYLSWITAFSSKTNRFQLTHMCMIGILY